MDVVLRIADDYVFDGIYRNMPALPIPSNAFALDFDFKTTLNLLPRDSMLRQTLSLYVLTFLGAFFMYVVFATTSYFLVFDKASMRHPKFLKNQIWLEIKMSMEALPWIAVFTTPWMVGEVRGHSMLYDSIIATPVAAATAATVVTSSDPTSSEFLQHVLGGVVFASSNSTVAAKGAIAELLSTIPGVNKLTDGWGYVGVSVLAFLLFTDCGIYWIHRFLHHPLIYKRLHKPHHKWIVPTPFSSHAFHPMDGYLQSVPYHLFVFLVPMQKFIYLGMFMFVNCWSVMIHDGEFIASNKFINGAAHHSLHHLYFNYNYGQYTTFWDRIGGSYRKPTEEQYSKTLKMDAKTWNKQAQQVESFDEFGKPTLEEFMDKKPTKQDDAVKSRAPGKRVLKN